MSKLRQLCPRQRAAALLLVVCAACGDPPTDALGPGDLTDAAFAKGGPNQLPTGGGIIFFSSYISGNGDLFSVNVDGTDLRRLTFTSEEELNPAVSPDGKKIAFGDLRIVLANGGASTLVLAGYDAFGTLSWSR